MQKQISVGICGFGKSGRIFHAPLVQASKDFYLYSILSSRTSEIKAVYPDVKVEDDFSNMVANPEIDLMIIGVPNHLHFDYGKQALENNKHVLIEKPIATSSKEAYELIKLAKQKNRVLTVFQNRRFDKDFQLIKSLLEKGDFGNLSRFESRFDRFRPIPKPGWKENADVAGGNLYDLGAHLIDQAVFLFGKPDRIHYDIETQRPDAINTDYFELTLYYGTQRVILGASNLIQGNLPRFSVHGDKASFYSYGIDPQESLLDSKVLPGDEKWKQTMDSFRGTLFSENGKTELNAKTLEYDHFYQQLGSAILENKKPPVDPENAAYVLSVIEKAY